MCTRACASVLVSVCVCARTPYPPSTYQRPLRIVTYNIAGGHKGFDVGRVSSVLASLHADIICLQEVLGTAQDDTQAHAIASVLGMSVCVFAEACLFTRGTYGVAILTNLTLTDIRRVALPPGSRLTDSGDRMPGSTEPRVALVCRVSPFPSAPHLNFDCACTHLGIYNTADSTGPDAACAAPLAAICAAISPGPAVACGDWNFSSPDAIARMCDTGWAVVPSAASFRSITIDFLFHRTAGLWTHTSTVTTHTAETEEASDHRPVTMTWQPADATPAPGK